MTSLPPATPPDQVRSSTTFIGATVWPYRDPAGPVVVLPEAEAPLREAGYVRIPEDALERVAIVIRHHTNLGLVSSRLTARAVLKDLVEAKVVTAKDIGA